MKSRDTLYRKSGCTAYRLCRYFSIVSIDTPGRCFMKSGTQLSLLCRYNREGRVKRRRAGKPASNADWPLCCGDSSLS